MGKIINFKDIQKPKFKIGDVVQMKTWNELVDEYGYEKGYGFILIEMEYDDYLFPEDMKELCGLKYVITDFYKDRVFLEALEPVDDWILVFPKKIFRKVGK